MKTILLLLLLASSVFTHAQSLKEALYGGKLKSKPGTVIRKGDDLSLYTDSARKSAPADTMQTKAALPLADSARNQAPPAIDSAAVSVPVKQDSLAVADTAAAKAESGVLTEAPPVAKNNTTLWKEYINTVISALKSEVLPSKKIKKGSYYVIVSYTIDTSGQVSIGDVFLDPENAFLHQQIKDRLALDAPRLNPTLSSSGTPRKVTKKYSFTLIKE